MALNAKPNRSAQKPEQTLQCMEVWGGNQAVDNGVIMPGLDAWVYSQPYAGAKSGGDVHYVSSCASGRITRLLLADVSGHGASVGEIGERLRTLMRRYVNYLDQSRFIGHLNREFKSIARKGGFATAVAATYWAPTSVLVACNAGHPRPLWYRAKQRQWRFLEFVKDSDHHTLRNLPLGLIEPTEYEQFGVRLHKGDLVVFHTDALMEARNSEGVQLGEAGLLLLAEQIDRTDPQQFIYDLVQRINEHREGTPADDDVTILVFRHNGTTSKLSYLDHVRAIRSMLRNMVRGLFRNEPIAWPEMGIATLGGAMFNSLNNWWGGKSDK